MVEGLYFSPDLKSKNTMCLSPIHIQNKTRYYSLNHRIPFEIDCKCGHCAECSEELSKEWLYRSYFESLDTFNCSNNSFIYMDCLTYSNKNLPHLADFFPQFKGFSAELKNLNFPCFNYFHIREFMQLLRMKLKRSGYDYKENLKYFITSEYGTMVGKSHRPHYHILLYVKFDINPLVLSKYVSHCWKFGRTDGYGYRNRNYILSHNVISNSSPAQSKYRSIKYVSKYVQKSSIFEGEINNRLFRVSNSMDLLRVPREEQKDFMSKVKRYCCQFHRQSQGYGLAAIRNIDIKYLYDSGMVLFPSFDMNVNYKIPLPLYFKRKLFYTQVKVDEKRIWILNDSGKEYMKKHLERCVEYISYRLESKYLNLDNSKKFIFDNLGVKFEDLSSYMIFYRGRCKFGDFDFWNIKDISEEDIVIYNYSNKNDVNHFGFPFMSEDYLGNDVVGYKVLSGPIYTNQIYKDFIFYNSTFEDALSILNSNDSKILFESIGLTLHNERLNNVYKKLGYR